jgi:ubiquinone/menaquinone biosynthesis C-methylase UbiE
MSQLSGRSEQQRRTVRAFEAIAAHYDGMRFLHRSAERLLALADVARGAHLLDVATGTGFLALAAGEVVGVQGAVVGVDLTPAMLAQARQKLAQLGPLPVTFVEGDAEHLDFPDNSFDSVLCASSLFMLPDIPAALREGWRVLKPGRRFGFSSFEAGLTRPLRDLWEARLQQHGLPTNFPPIQRLGDAERCAAVLRAAGFEEVVVHREQLGYTHADPQARWAELEAGLEVMPLQGLDAAQRAQIRDEHLAELADFATRQPLWVDVPALFAFGVKPR